MLGPPGGPGGAPMPMPGPGGPPGAPPHLPRPPQPPKEQPPVKPKEPKVIPWKPAPIAKITKASPWRKKAPSWETVIGHADVALKRWEPRQRHIEEQQRIIYRRPIFEAADGTPINPAEGELVHLRSKPARDFARYVSLAEPTAARIRRQLKPRVRTEAVENAAQVVENALRDQWRRDEQAWLNRSSLGDPQPALSYKLSYLLAAQGGVGWCYRWNDGPDQERHPYVMEPIPWSELFPVDGVATVRVTRLPLSEARAQYPEIHEAYPAQDEQDRDKDYPTDDTKVRIVGWGDVWGQWWALAWDFEEGERRGKRDGQDARWIVAPTAINYGFPYYRVLLPFATGAPALEDDQDERIRHTARGVLADRLGDIRMQDQLVSAMATGAVKGIDPPVVVKLSERRNVDENGKIIPPKIERAIGGKTWLLSDESLETPDTSFTAVRDVANMLSMLGSDDNDASPAVLAGRDSAPSGFARALGSEAAAALYVDPLQNAHATLIQLVDADRVTLLWRAMSGTGQATDADEDDAGDDVLLTGLAVTGNEGEQELTAKDLELAGPETVITYRDNNMATRLQLVSMYEGLVQRGMVSKQLALDEMGFEEPELILRDVLKDQALELPPFKEALIDREVMDTEDPYLIDAFHRALERVQNQNAPPGQPGMPSPPGAAPQPGGSAVPPQVGG